MDLDTVLHWQRALRKAEQTASQARARLHASIAAALEHGTRQADIARATGYSREQLRRIARAAESRPPQSRPAAQDDENSETTAAS